ncbi:chorismate synthase [Portibacter lacus]|uniref:Chorismate synthase n=1 Tax=Portibacter lacus TaxID=1099794 RepID=A0AA37WHG2_9BACT|nr:chorismate synthase [Portibacter lacus]GLR19289.1 chorismate synthase [Portibacter lacus]
MNSFGRIFRMEIFGESHGEGCGVLLDGVPPGIPITVEDFLPDLKRRQAGAKGTTPRVEKDIPHLKSGVFNGFTTGAPLLIFFENNNTRSKDYSNLVRQPRPGHSDFVAHKKYKGFQDYRGGGHFSGRLTLALVAAGVIAKKITPEITYGAQLIEAGGNSNIEEAINGAIESKNSIGGIIESRASNIPIGIGEPFFDSVESIVAHLVFAIPATKGVEFGSGFQAAKMTGIEHNDNFIDEKGTTETNNAAGINGGITNGNDFFFRVAIKPTSSVHQTQKTMNLASGEVEDLMIVGRHDVCIALRAPVVVEAITAIAFAELSLIREINK